MKAAVIGAAGKMGSWFTRYFTEKGFETNVYDIDREGSKKVAEKYNARQAADLNAAIIDADVVLISVPIPMTPKVVLNVLEVVKDNAVVVEITSFKQNVIGHLKTAERNAVTLLSLHPMFGYGTKSLSGHKMVVVQVKNIEREVAAAQTLFPDAEVIPTTAKKHDEAMATVLALTHFVNFVFASTLPIKDIEKIRRLSGTSFNLQLTLAESILHDDPEFLATLQKDNRYAIRSVNRLVKEAEALRTLVANKDRQELVTRLRSLKKLMKKDKQFEDAYKKMYEMMETLLGN
ncbi:MAG: prephenate dehydrogenase/arogenate dehydrogenase family protein [Nitrososphaerales archaeon]